MMHGAGLGAVLLCYWGATHQHLLEMHNHVATLKCFGFLCTFTYSCRQLSVDLHLASVTLTPEGKGHLEPAILVIQTAFT